jgi:hypothetical protein
MGKFHELEEFESAFDAMGVGALKWWKWYWTRHAEGLTARFRKQAMKRVRDIEKAIEQKGGNESGAPEMEMPEDPEVSRIRSMAVSPTQKAKARIGRIMYIERKAGSLTGAARIGRVTFSKTGRTIHYRGQRFQSLKGAGFKSNYYDVDTGEDYWISGPKRRGGDALYGGSIPIEIDEDVREEYWRDIRQQPKRVHETVA